jgi:hypothetical protein
MAKISTRNITAENVEDVMGTAAYGGITYWAVEPTQADFDAAPEGAHTIRDGDPDEGTGVYYLTPAKIKQAIVEVAEGKHTNTLIAGYVQSAFNYWNAEDGIDCGDIDADAADCIVQVACFGEVRYG